mgnify:CR=1 FL=1
MLLQDLFPKAVEFGADGRLRLAGEEMGVLAQRWGTPLYIYDGETIRDRAELVAKAARGVYPGEFEIAYAAKAFFSLPFAKKLARMGLAVDVASATELDFALQAGFRPSLIHLHGNSKSEEEVDRAIEAGVAAIVLDSLDEITWVEGRARSLDKRAAVWLRINPETEVSTHHFLQTGVQGAKFGLPLSDGQAKEGISRLLSSPWLTLRALHFHLGSQLFGLPPYFEALDKILALAESAGYVPEILSPGGGWGVPYTADAEAVDIENWVSALSRHVFDASAARGWPAPKLVVEPGRWLVAPAGVAIYTVGSIKKDPSGIYWVALDGGMGDNPRPELYQASYTACLADNWNGRPEWEVALAGRYCESGDVLVPHIALPPLARGQVVAIPVSGAYQLSMSSNYNLVPRPAVLWHDAGSVELLQPREDLQASPWWRGSA